MPQNGLSSLEKAIKIVQDAGLVIRGQRPVKLKRKEISRINYMLTFKGKVVVTHNGKRASVLTIEGYRGRSEGGRKGAKTKYGNV